MGWERVDTMRCASCQVFVPVSEILFAGDGTAHCLACGVPSVDLEALLVREDGYRPPYGIVAAAIGVTNLLFFAAAYVSQL